MLVSALAPPLLPHASRVHRLTSVETARKRLGNRSETFAGNRARAAGRVFVDTDLLKSLGTREIAEGLAEVVKMGVIRCAPLFEAMEATPLAILALDAERVAYVTGEAIRLKAEVVALDEKEVRAERAPAEMDAAACAGLGRPSACPRSLPSG
jgi:hypothetical protein